MKQANILLVCVGILAAFYALSQTYWQAASSVAEELAIPAPGQTPEDVAGGEQKLSPLPAGRGDSPEGQGSSTPESNLQPGRLTPQPATPKKAGGQPTRMARPLPPPAAAPAAKRNDGQAEQPNRSSSGFIPARNSRQPPPTPTLPGQGAGKAQKRGAGDDPPPPPVRSSMPEQRPPR